MILESTVPARCFWALLTCSADSKSPSTAFSVIISVGSNAPVFNRTSHYSFWFCFPFESESCYVAKYSLKLKILLPLLPKYWKTRCVLHHHAQLCCFEKRLLHNSHFTSSASHVFTRVGSNQGDHGDYTPHGISAISLSLSFFSSQFNEHLQNLTCKFT